MRIKTLQLGATFLLFLLLAGSVKADPLREDLDWLKTMAFAAHQTNYAGVFVYQSGGRIEMSRITHIVDQSGEHERLEGLDGLKREIIRDNDKVWLYLGDKKVRIEKRRTHRAFPALLPEQIQTLKENYQISQGEEDRVADYHAHTVIFQPKDGLRYTRKMWAHSGSGLLLKEVVLDEQNRVIEEYAFSQLEIGGKNLDRKWIVPNEKEAARLGEHKNLSPLPAVSLEKADTGWQIDSVPAGFKKILEMRRLIGDKKLPVEHIVYSDGLSAISVFIEKVNDVTDVPGLSGRGAVHIYNRLVGDNLVTVVGEVPPLVIIQVADSVRYAGE